MASKRNEFMNLRGGSLETSPPYEDSVEELKAIQPQPLFWVMGFQGIYGCPSRHYLEFAEAAARVLSFNYSCDFDVCVHFYDTDPSGTLKVATMHTVQGTLSLKEPPAAACPIWAELQRRLGPHGTTFDGYRFATFVHYKGEKHPVTPLPNEAESLSIIKLSDFTTGSSAYMRVPEVPNNYFKQHHYSSEYFEAMRVLFPDTPLLDYTWWINSKSGQKLGIKGRSFGGLDPPPQLWDRVVNDIEENDEAEEVVMTDVGFFARPISTDSVPILVPGFYPQHQNLKVMGLRNLRMHNSDEDERQLQIIREALWESNPALRNFPATTGMDVWIPGEWIMRKDKRPFKIMGNGLRAVEDWRIAAHTFDIRTYDATKKACIAARPLFESYQIWKADGWKSVTLDLNNTSRAEFVKAVAENLFQGEMSPQSMWSSDDRKCLYIRQTTWGRTPITAVIGPNTTEEEWSWIVRHIVEPDITVSIQRWDIKWGKQNPHHEHRLKH